MSFSNRVDQGYLSFAKGLVTEYNPLSAPEGTTFDELNMDVDTNGLVRVRRNPMQTVASFSTGPSPCRIVSAEHWKRYDKFVYVLERFSSSSAGVQSVHIVVTNKTGSPVELNFPIDVPVEVYVEPDIKFVRDLCIIVVGGLPIVLMREASGNYSALNVNIQIRDFKLIEDGSRISQRPTTNNTEHVYNILNAGWYQHRKVKDAGKPVSDPIVFFESIRSEYPSNADIPYLGDITDGDGDLVFDPASFDNIDTGSTEAPRGHYIFSIRNIDRPSRVTTKTNDGSLEGSVVPILEDGDIPGTGLPPNPDTPYVPPDGGWCDPITGICNEVP